MNFDSFGDRMKEYEGAEADRRVMRRLPILAHLDGRIAALRAEMSRPAFAFLPGDEQDRVASQLAWMTGYSKVLGERIAAFTTNA